MVSLAEFPVVLRDTARSLREAGDSDMARQLSRDLRAAAKPVLGEIRTGLPGFMPRRYAGVLSGDLSLTSSVRLAGAAGASVTLKAGTRSGKARKLKRLDASGILTHPLFGSRKHWYSQTSSVKAGFFTRPVTDSREQFEGAVRAAMDQVARDVAERHA